MTMIHSYLSLFSLSINDWFQSLTHTAAADDDTSFDTFDTSQGKREIKLRVSRSPWLQFSDLLHFHSRLTHFLYVESCAICRVGNTPNSSIFKIIFFFIFNFLIKQRCPSINQRMAAVVVEERNCSWTGLDKWPSTVWIAMPTVKTIVSKPKLGLADHFGHRLVMITAEIRSLIDYLLIATDWLIIYLIVGWLNFLLFWTGNFLLPSKLYQKIKNFQDWCLNQYLNCIKNIFVFLHVLHIWTWTPFSVNHIFWLSRLREQN